MESKVEEFLFDDCPLCRAQKKALAENRNLSYGELQTAFKKAEKKREKIHDGMGSTLDLMLQATQKVASFLSGYDFEKFTVDGKTQSAIIMQLIVMGELAKKLPDELKVKINLPWKLMAGFRDFAVHE